MNFSKFIRWVHANIKRHGFHPWVRKIPGGGHGNTLQYSCLENPVDRGAWRDIAHGVVRSQKSLKWLSTHACTHIYAEQEIRGSFVFYTFLVFLNFNITFIFKTFLFKNFKNFSLGKNKQVSQVVDQFSCSVMSNSLQPHGLQHTRLPCPSPSPRACSNSCPSSW